MSKGQLIVLSGPSGVGKGTVLKKYLETATNGVVSVSATTRKPRPGEQDGIDYHFIDRETFMNWVEKGEMLEYTEYNGNFYGTPLKKVDEVRDMGKNVILEIEVDGASQVKKTCPEAILIFIMPPSLNILRMRLVDRNTEDAETIEKRLAIAQTEFNKAYEYDYIIVNDVVEKAVNSLKAIVKANKCSVVNMKNFINEVSNNA
ncbi:MAG: guanylate kinase [Oscillospiraceae bacterium]